jgi:hypothetical protein
MNLVFAAGGAAGAAAGGVVEVLAGGFAVAAEGGWADEAPVVCEPADGVAT